MDNREKDKKDKVEVKGALGRLSGSASSMDSKDQKKPKEKAETSEKKSLKDTFLELAPLLIGTAVGGLGSGFQAQAGVQQAQAQQAQAEQARGDVELKQQQNQQRIDLEEKRFQASQENQQMAELDRADGRDLQRSQQEQQAAQFAQNLELKHKQLDQEKAIQLEKLEAANMSAKSKGVKLTEAQSKSRLFGSRMLQSEDVLSKLEAGGNFDPTDLRHRAQSKLPNELQSAEFQQYTQAKRNFLSAVLRKESGAKISDDEIKDGNLNYFPQPGDSPEVVLQKRQTRLLASKLLAAEGGVEDTQQAPLSIQSHPRAGQIIKSKGVIYRVGTDGTLEQVK